MKFTQLKNSVKEGAKPIYLFEGEETYFTDRGPQMLIDAFVTEPSLNAASVDGSKMKGNAIEDFISLVYAYPFLSEKRLVKVTNFFPTEKEYDTYFKGLFENPVESTILVIVNTTKAKAGVCDLKKKPNVTCVDCGKASEEDVYKWIFLTFKKSSIYVDSSVCQKLADYCTLSMARISKEVEKLILYAGEGGRITDSDVDNLVYKDSDYKIYELTSAVARENYTAFVCIMQDLLGKGFDEMSFLSALGSYYKNLYDCLCFDGTDAEAAKILGIKEYGVKKNREQARKIKKEKLEYFVNVFYGGVSDIKNGKITPASSLSLVTAKIFF